MPKRSRRRVWNPENPREIDHWIAVNLKVNREKSGLSQKDLAERMRERGHTWSQDTVWKVETEARQVRASELADLTEIVTAHADWYPYVDLDVPPGAHLRQLRVLQARADVETAREAIGTATTQYLEARAWEVVNREISESHGDPSLPADPTFESPELVALEARIRYDLAQLHTNDDQLATEAMVVVDERVRLIKKEFAELIGYPFGQPKWEDTEEGRELIGEENLPLPEMPTPAFPSASAALGGEERGDV